MHSENIKLDTCLRPYDSQVRLSFFLEMCGPLERERGFVSFVKCIDRSLDFFHCLFSNCFPGLFYN